MQTTCGRWEHTYDWQAGVFLTPDPQVPEQGLLIGRVLARLGRTPALDFHLAAEQGRLVDRIQQHELGATMAVTRHAGKELLPEDVAHGLRLLGTAPANSMDALLDSGIPSVAPAVTEEASEAFRQFVWPHSDASGRAVVLYVTVWAASLCCTCEPFMRYFQCEHVIC